MAEDSEGEKDKSDVDSKFEERSNHSVDDSQDEQDGSDVNSDLDLKNDVNQAVLEDD
jgi:hypothetical protein